MEYELADLFDVENCDFCGECISRCPELSCRIADPSGAIRSLVSGEYITSVLERCSSCMSCNVICPKGCNPYGLILFHWWKREQERGLPMRASLVMPLEPGNAWHRVMGRLPAPERALLDEWADLGRSALSGRALFAGCNLQILPYMSESSIFEGLPVFGSPELCCGEVYYRMGVLGRVEAQARRLESIYADIGVTEVVAYCQACYNILKNVLPGRFDAKFPFKTTYFGDILAERVLGGELDVKGRLSGLKVTVQDPCHSKLLGTGFQERPRKMLEHMGCEVLEMKHTRELALCCGLGHGAPRHNPLDMTRGIVNRLREARATGADYLVVYCNSCDLLFSAGTQLTPWRIPVYHLNELVSMALGEEPKRANLSRARSMVSELFVRGAPKLLSRKRFSA